MSPKQDISQLLNFRQGRVNHKPKYPKMRNSCVLLLLLTTSSIIYANPLSLSLSSSSNEEADKVVVALYYETLCPYCTNLIVNDLYKIFDDGLYDISLLKLIPYGNAKIRNNTIVCQVLFDFLFLFFGFLEFVVLIICTTSRFDFLC